MEISERIKELRAQAGLSQQEFADRIGCTKSQVGQWEVGNNYPKIENLIAIAQTFKVSTDWILTGGSAIKKPQPGKVEASEGLTSAQDRQQMKDELLIKTANAAIQVADKVMSSLETIQTKGDLTLLRLQGVEQFLTQRFAQVQKVAPAKVAKELDTHLTQFANTHKMNSLATVEQGT